MQTFSYETIYQSNFCTDALSADVEAKDFAGNTPLHVAAANGCSDNVIALLFEGNAKANVANLNGETPLHQAKTSKILDNLLMKTNIEDFLDDELKNKVQMPLFDQILQKHPKSMKTYLDSMVTSSNADSDSHDQHLIFHLSMFDHNSNEKHNNLDKPLELIEKGCEDLLRHPLMRLFVALKWRPHKLQYKMNLFVFSLFLIIFTFHGLICIDFLQCDDPPEENGFENPFNKENELYPVWIEYLKKIEINCQFSPLDNQAKTCMEPLASEMAFHLTRYLSLSLLLILMGMEILQFISKIVTFEVREFFSLQNVTEVILLCVTSAFFVVQYTEENQSPKSGTQEHLLGWALFLAWSDLTIYLARFDPFGQVIHIAWQVSYNVASFILVSLPTVAAFTTAFHCFLRRNEVFQGPISSLIKILTMMVGEFDFEDNFLYDKVNENDDCNFSVQVLIHFIQA